MRFLRSSGALLLFGLGVLLLGLGLVSASLLFSMAVSGGFSGRSFPVRFPLTWTLVTLGSLAAGAGLLTLYRRLRQPAPWERAPANRLALRRNASGWFSRLGRLIRRLSGGLLLMAAAPCLFIGLIGEAVHLMTTASGRAAPWPEDQWMSGSVWWCLPLGFLLVWGTYLCWTDQEELQTLVDWSQRRFLLSWLRHLLALDSGRKLAQPKEEISQYGWRWVIARVAALWLICWAVGYRFGFWPGGAKGVPESAAVCCLLWVGTAGFIVVHEIGHVLAGWLAGLVVTGMRVGRGPLLLNQRWHGIHVRWHAWPADGRAEVGSPATEHWYRSRLSVLYLGGPLAHALCVAAVLWGAGLLPAGPAQAVTVLGLAGAYFLVFGSLLPFRLDQQCWAPFGFEQEVWGRTGPILFDSAAILNCLRLPAAQIRWAVCANLLRAPCPLAFSQVPEERQTAVAALETLLEKYPGNVVPRIALAVAAGHRQDWAQMARLLGDILSSTAVLEQISGEVRSWARAARVFALVWTRDHVRARTEMEALLAGDDSVEWKITQLDHLASLPLMSGLKGYDDEALRWIDAALALAPERLTLLGTRGSLLVEAGRHKEARPLLDRVRIESVSPYDQGICALYLAIIARTEGRETESTALAAEAFRLCPGQPWMTERWQRLDRS